MDGVETKGLGVLANSGTSGNREFRLVLGLSVVGSSDRRRDFQGLEFLARESELPMARSSDYSQDFRHTLVANPYMWLQIHANIHTMKVEEERGKKKRSKSQGTLQLGLAMEVIPWEEEEKDEKHEIHGEADFLRPNPQPPHDGG